MNLINVDDTELNCGICGEAHKYTECSLVQITNSIPDNVVLTKARLTLPKSLRIEKMSEGSHSVISTGIIKEGTQFGPFEAEKIFSLDPEIIFPLKIFTPSGYFSEYYLNTNDEDCCNWMMFITPAANVEEQNLICFQDDCKIYYVSIRDITAGEFLKVWYGSFYAKKMNKTELTSQKTLEENLQSVTDLNLLLKKQQNLMERDTWTCKFCSIQEKDVTKFAHHITEHYSMQVRKVCEICKSVFTTHKGLKKHFKIVHSDTNNVKLTTDTTRNTRNEVNIVKDSLLGGPLLNDTLTDSLDNTNLLLQQTDISQFDMSNIENQNILLENDNLNLSVDNLLSDNNFDFEISDDKEEYICDICLKHFSKLKLLVQHLQKHTGKYTCTECLMIFSRNENLKAHKCNFKRPQHKCALCQKLFSQKKYVARHMQSVHEKRHQCPKCEKLFHSDKEFRVHNCPSVPDSEKEKYPCTVCSKIFYRESYMKKHMRVHMPEKIKRKSEPLMCEICSKTFQSLKYLHQHKKIHAEPSHACKVCNKTFTRPDTLNVHLVACHSPESHSCAICDKKCKSKKYLKNHMQTHSDSKKHKCSACDKQFLLRSNMLKHYSNRHKEICAVCKGKQCIHKRIPPELECYYECPLCKKAFKLRSSATRHLKKSHPNAKQDYSKISKIDVTLMKISQDNNNSKNIPNMLPIKNNSTVDINKKNNLDTETASFLYLKNKSVTNIQNLDNLTSSFEKIVNQYETNEVLESEYPNTVFDKEDMSICLGSEEKNNETVLDFNNLELDLDAAFNIPQDLQINQEVCLSMPELTDMDRDITLGRLVKLVNDFVTLL